VKGKRELDLEKKKKGVQKKRTTGTGVLRRASRGKTLRKRHSITSPQLRKKMQLKRSLLRKRRGGKSGGNVGVKTGQTLKSGYACLKKLQVKVRKGKRDERRKGEKGGQESRVRIDFGTIGET